MYTAEVERAWEEVLYHQEQRNSGNLNLRDSFKVFIGIPAKEELDVKTNG